MKQLVILLFSIMALSCNSKKTEYIPYAGSDDSIMVANGYDVIEMTKTKTGHITATFNVNGKPCVFLIDTGGGATLVDISKKEKYELEESGKRNYAAGVGARTSLIKTSADIKIKDHETKTDELFLMDISYINAEFIKNKVKPVDGVLGTDFLEKYDAIIDYPHSKIYLKFKTIGKD